MGNTAQQIKKPETMLAYWQGWGRDVIEVWMLRGFSIAQLSIMAAGGVMVLLGRFAGWFHLPDLLYILYGLNIAGVITLVALVGETLDYRKNKD